MSRPFTDEETGIHFEFRSSYRSVGTYDARLADGTQVGLECDGHPITGSTIRLRPSDENRGVDLADIVPAWRRYCAWERADFIDFLVERKIPADHAVIVLTEAERLRLAAA